MLLVAGAGAEIPKVQSCTVLTGRLIYDVRGLVFARNDETSEILYPTEKEARRRPRAIPGIEVVDFLVEYSKTSDTGAVCDVSTIHLRNVMGESVKIPFGQSLPVHRVEIGFAGEEKTLVIWKLIRKNKE